MTASSVPNHRPYRAPIQSTQDLPFTVRLAKGAKDMQDLITLRQQVYGKHVPGIARKLETMETDDKRPDALILVARSKSNDQLLGSVRLVNNLSEPLRVESEITLPPQFKRRKLAEARRLVVVGGTAGRAVSASLIKAAFEICFRAGIDDTLITARHPVDRMYRMMQFDDLLGTKKITLPDASNLPHSLFGMPIQEAETRWVAAACPLYDFMATTLHPDIDINYDTVRHRFCAQHAPNSGFAAAAQPSCHLSHSDNQMDKQPCTH
jgi:predicted GNAT family N-acyltransferase